MPSLPRSLSIDLSHGGTLNLFADSDDRGRPFRIRPLDRIAPRFFNECPICGAKPTVGEHVPPARMGGRLMTGTCAPCNNKLGANVEADLVDWHDGALTLPRFSADVVPGARRSTRILYRYTSDGSFVLLVDGTVDPAVRDMLEGGHVDLRALLPDINRVRLALLNLDTPISLWARRVDLCASRFGR